MRHLGLTALTLAALALTPNFASAQGFGRGFGGGAGMLVGNKGVQKEIKATDEQIAKLDALAAETREKMTEARSKTEGLEGEERRNKAMEINREINAGVMTSLGSILKPEQTKRFEQISLQSRGAQAFADPKVAEGLKITDEQKDKLKEINESANEKRRELMQGFQDDREGTMKKLAEFNKELMGKVAALMTDDQKKTWKEMTGEPYEIKFEPRPNN